MKVVCVYKSGGDYDIRYVAALKIGLDHCMPIPYDFYCLTDCPEEVLGIAHPIELEYPDLLFKWWSKIELFNPKHFPSGRVLYFDLDVIPLHDLSAFIKVCEESTHPLFLRSADKIGKENNWPSSSIMCWENNEMSEVYNSFFYNPDIVLTDAAKEVSYAGQRTDQGFIRKIINPDIKFQDLLPEAYITFKIEYMHDNSLVDKASILNWTGYPRLHFEVFPFRNIWKERIEEFINI